MRLSPSNTRTTIQNLPVGPQGTRETLRHMARFVRAYRKDVPRIRELALSIVADVSGTHGGRKNFGGMVSAIQRWVRDHIQFVRDVRDVETLATPVKTLEYGAGDCDDHATLLAALLESIGFRTRFVAIKMQPFGPFVHVYTEVNLGRRWIPLETTEKFSAGHFPRVAGRMIQNI